MSNGFLFPFRLLQKEIKAYNPSTNSISEGQVLSCPYPYDKARIIVMEMADNLVYS